MESAEGCEAGAGSDYLFGDARFGVVEPSDRAGDAHHELAGSAHAAAFEDLNTVLDELFATGLTPTDSSHANALVEQLESVASRVNAAQRDLLGEIHRTGVFGTDGHTSAKAMVRHTAHLSPGEANARTRDQRALAAMPAFATAFRAGEVSTCVVARLARLHANPRIRDQVEALDQQLLHHARTKPFAWFDAHCADLERVLDADGADRRNERAHAKRDLSITQNFDRTWNITGHGAALEGARFREIFDHFVDAEWHTDWEVAKATHGDNTTPGHLARSAAQRRFDAALAMAEAAATNPNSVGGAKAITTNLVIDQATFERELARLLDADTPSVDVADPERLNERLESFRCATTDGHQVSAREAVLNALTNQIRRVVVNSAGVVIDLGRKQRLFTGSARLAVQLRANQCFHPSCLAHGRGLQVDHVHEWARDHGSTNPGNGAPGCGHHNRWKSTHHISARRNADGTWTLTRPDGTTIE